MAKRPPSSPYNKEAKKLLFTTFNCAKAQLIPLQRLSGVQNDALIMALTGLAGGMLNNGSTCGVVIGGAVSSAMIRDQELAGQWTPAEKIRLLAEIRDDVRWFEARFKTSLCRERDDLNYQRITVLGLLHPQKAKGCVARTGASMDRFVARYTAPPEKTRPAPPAPPACLAEDCAPQVLREIRTRTGVGDETLERIATAFDGGLGLSGGGCGALAGALMALGLKFALDPKKTDPKKLANIYKAMDSEFFRQAVRLVKAFVAEFGAFECRRLTGKHFQNWDEFCAFRNTAACDRLNRFLVDRTAEIINDPAGDRTRAP